MPANSRWDLIRAFKGYFDIPRNSTKYNSVYGRDDKFIHAYLFEI